MPAKRKITLNRKKKEPVNEVEEKVVSLEEAIEEITWEENPITTAIESIEREEEPVVFSKTQLKGEIVGSKWRTTVQPPKWRIMFEAQVAPVPMFRLPDEIRRYLESNWLPTTIWKWDKEKLEKRHVDMKMVEKLKAFLSGNY